MNVLDQYVKDAPSNQSVVDIFKGEWSSILPPELEAVSTPGTAALFQDNRIDWLSAQIGGFRDKTILELGPLEAGHTYMMNKAGAKKIVAVEANTRSYLKCLCIREISNMDGVEFKLGDAAEFMRISTEAFDVCVASGILYHVLDPIGFIELLARMSRRLFIWTHFYDQDRIAALGPGTQQFSTPFEIKRDGHVYKVSKRAYQTALSWAGFCGGSSEYALWLDRVSLLSALRDAGFSDIKIGSEDLDHPNGPAITLLATR